MSSEIPYKEQIIVGAESQLEVHKKDDYLAVAKDLREKLGLEPTPELNAFNERANAIIEEATEKAFTGVEFFRDSEEINSALEAQRFSEELNASTVMIVREAITTKLNQDAQKVAIEMQTTPITRAEVAEWASTRAVDRLQKTLTTLEPETTITRAYSLSGSYYDALNHGLRADIAQSIYQRIPIDIYESYQGQDRERFIKLHGDAAKAMIENYCEGKRSLIVRNNDYDQILPEQTPKESQDIKNIMLACMDVVSRDITQTEKLPKQRFGGQNQADEEIIRRSQTALIVGSLLSGEQVTSTDDLKNKLELQIRNLRIEPMQEKKAIEYLDDLAIAGYVADKLTSQSIVDIKTAISIKIALKAIQNEDIKQTLLQRLVVSHSEDVAVEASIAWLIDKPDRLQQGENSGLKTQAYEKFVYEIATEQAKAAKEEAINTSYDRYYSRIVGDPTGIENRPVTYGVEDRIKAGNELIGAIKSRERDIILLESLAPIRTDLSAAGEIAHMTDTSKYWEDANKVLKYLAEKHNIDYFTSPTPGYSNRLEMMDEKDLTTPQKKLLAQFVLAKLLNYESHSIKAALDDFMGGPGKKWHQEVVREPLIDGTDVLRVHNAVLKGHQIIAQAGANTQTGDSRIYFGNELQGLLGGMYGREKRHILFENVNWGYGDSIKSERAGNVNYLTLEDPTSRRQIVSNPTEAEIRSRTLQLEEKIQAVNLFTNEKAKRDLENYKFNFLREARSGRDYRHPLTYTDAKRVYGWDTQRVSTVETYASQSAILIDNLSTEFNARDKTSRLYTVFTSLDEQIAAIETTDLRAGVFLYDQQRNRELKTKVEATNAKLKELQIDPITIQIGIMSKPEEVERTIKEALYKIAEQEQSRMERLLNQLAAINPNLNQLTRDIVDKRVSENGDVEQIQQDGKRQKRAIVRCTTEEALATTLDELDSANAGLSNVSTAIEKFSRATEAARGVIYVRDSVLSQKITQLTQRKYEAISATKSEINQETRKKILADKLTAVAQKVAQTDNREEVKAQLFKTLPKNTANKLAETLR